MTPVFIIAEAGVNHNGDLDRAKTLIKVAKEAGVDAVKFQTFFSQNLVSKFAEKAQYQVKTTGAKETQLAMLQKLELSKDVHKVLLDYCKSLKITFLSSPFDIESIHFLNELGLEVLKIPSGEITNLPYLREIASLGKKVIMSTGMATLQEVQAALNVILSKGLTHADITLLHCNTEYPTPFDDVNLKVLKTLEQSTGVSVGFSDHTPGIEAAIAAVALGAKVIEKHFTLDKELEGPDHKASLLPCELKRLVEGIRNIEKAMGAGDKVPSDSEEKNITVVRKSIVAKRSIKQGENFSLENITTKRPGNGISPMRWDEILGQKAARDFQEDELIELL